MVLDAILQRQRDALAAFPPDGAQLRDRIAALDDPLDFCGALLAGPNPALIAECKRSSPVKGVLQEDYDAARQARAYADGGASALSVLTSPEFDGRLEHLQQARAAVRLPLLRKDFILDPGQLLEARAYGADCVLLIARALGAALLGDMVDRARELSLQTLVEIHAESEVDGAVAAAPDLLGVNCRDLQTFEVDTAVVGRVAPLLPLGLPLVAESGISTREDVVAVGRAGARAVLVGETLMRAADPAAEARALLGITR
jgi:indole-3-glycerol phosphate synthase